jgi:hypothetical protein
MPNDNRTAIQNLWRSWRRLMSSVTRSPPTNLGPTTQEGPRRWSQAELHRLGVAGNTLGEFRHREAGLRQGTLTDNYLGRPRHTEADGLRGLNMHDLDYQSAQAHRMINTYNRDHLFDPMPAPSKLPPKVVEFSMLNGKQTGGICFVNKATLKNGTEVSWRNRKGQLMTGAVTGRTATGKIKLITHGWKHTSYLEAEELRVNPYK